MPCSLAGGQQQQEQQQELMERLMSAGGLQAEGLESLVGLAAKQAAKEEELGKLRKQVGCGPINLQDQATCRAGG